MKPEWVRNLYYIATAVYFYLWLRQPWAASWLLIQLFVFDVWIYEGPFVSGVKK